MWNVIGIAGICTKPTKLDSLQKTHTSYYCLKQYIAKCLQSINKFLLMRVHYKVSRVPSRVASLDPSGLLDIASFICICSRVFSVVKVRQSEESKEIPFCHVEYEQRLQFGSSFLSFALQHERSCYARLPASTLLSPLSPHTFPLRLTHFVSSEMNETLNLLWHLSELQIY